MVPEKITNSQLMVGSVVQYMLDNEILKDIYETKIFLVILRFTIGYRKRFAYISQDKFLDCMSIDSLKRYRQKLVDKKIIEIRKTMGYTYYRLLEPQELIKKFKLQESNSIKNPFKEKKSNE